MILLLKCNNVIDINNRSYSELEIVKDWETYEEFLMWIHNEYKNKTDTKIKMSSLSWYRFMNDWCNEDNEDYMKNKNLLDKFITIERSDNGKCVYKYNYNKLSKFSLF